MPAQTDAGTRPQDFAAPGPRRRARGSIDGETTDGRPAARAVGAAAHDRHRRGGRSRHRVRGTMPRRRRGCGCSPCWRRSTPCAWRSAYRDVGTRYRPASPRWAGSAAASARSSPSLPPSSPGRWSTPSASATRRCGSPSVSSPPSSASLNSSAGRRRRTRRCPAGRRRSSPWRSRSSPVRASSCWRSAPAPTGARRSSRRLRRRHSGARWPRGGHPCRRPRAARRRLGGPAARRRGRAGERPAGHRRRRRRLVPQPVTARAFAPRTGQRVGSPQRSVRPREIASSTPFCGFEACTTALPTPSDSMTWPG